MEGYPVVRGEPSGMGSSPYKRDSRELCAMGGHKKTAVCNQKRALTGTSLCWHSDLIFPAVKNKFLLLLSHPVYGML